MRWLYAYDHWAAHSLRSPGQGAGFVVQSGHAVMVIGQGLIARSFYPRYGKDGSVLIFASGVSNSREQRCSEFDRERILLTNALSSSNGKLVYFSSCGVESRDSSPYMCHKRHMESLVLGSPEGMVFRLPQVVGRTENPNTLTNYLHARIVRGEQFTVWANAERNLIDIDDVVAICTRLIDGPSPQRTVSVVSGRALPIPVILSLFERALGCKADYVIEQKGSGLPTDGTIAAAIAKELGIDFGPDYAERTIRKYYPSA